jgi:alpha-amylase
MTPVAAIARSLPGGLLALAVAACNPAPSGSPEATHAETPGATRGAVSSPPACVQKGPSPPLRPAWHGRVFYEVFVRSFADADGDGIGDLAGLTDRLDYLNDGDPGTTDDLGVTGLWLMPVAEAASYHGYDVTDYTAIERDYGDRAAMRAFIEAAHERGIDVIVDLVINHTSRDHPWFGESTEPGSPREDWYLWADERPPVARSDGSRVWHEADGRFYYGYFWEGMPDLNLANAEVTAELDAVARFWLDDMGVDGFRLDAAKHLIEDGDRLENVDGTFEWLAGFRERIHATHPEALVLGEVFDATTVSSRYVREGSLDLTFDFGLASSTVTSLNAREAGPLNTALREAAESYPDDTLATFLTNHDQNRVASQLAGDPAGLRLAAALLLTGPGVPFIYYGEEIGMTGAKPDERIRTPMRWEPTPPGFGFTTAKPWEAASVDPVGTDVATQTVDPDSLLSTYRSLNRLRTSHPALLGGDLAPIEGTDRHLVAYLRSSGDAHALVVANLGLEAVRGPALTLGEGPLCGAAVVTALLGPDDVTAPVISSTGGFEGYVPVTELASREILVVDLATQ